MTIVALGMTLENGWPECDLSDCEQISVPGTPLRLWIRKGQPHAIIQAFIRDLNEHIEPVMNAAGIGDEGSWTENNSVWTSNHKGATAFDYNWRDHPVKIKDAGWNGSVLIPGDQVPAVRELLAWYEGMIYWGNDWTSFIDSMHFQMGYNTFGAQNVDRVNSFIQRKIRADGYSTWRRGGVPRGGGTAVEPSAPANPVKPTTGLTAQVLFDIAAQPAPVRVSLARYAELLPLVEEMFDRCDAGTIDRRAMLIAQLFHESGALFYKREIADGSAYEGRCKDLGNCQPGDGKRFRGRGWIQLTGRAHATGFSGWMFRQGLCPTPTHFADHPQEMETDRNAMLVVVYYWTVSRPQLNALADARNLDGATRAVNGGINGLADRRRYYDRALAANANLLSTVPADPIEELLMMELQSWSAYAAKGESKIPAAGMVQAIDRYCDEARAEARARRGDVESLARIARTAKGLGQYTDAATVSDAIAVLAQIGGKSIDEVKELLKG